MAVTSDSWLAKDVSKIFLIFLKKGKVKVVPDDSYHQCEGKEHYNKYVDDSNMTLTVTDSEEVILNGRITFLAEFEPNLPIQVNFEKLRKI